MSGYCVFIRRQYIKSVSVLAVLLLLSACSQQAVYENYQYYKSNECYKLPRSQQQECQEEAQRPFEEYERSRKGQ